MENYNKHHRKRMYTISIMLIATIAASIILYPSAVIFAAEETEPRLQSYIIHHKKDGSYYTAVIEDLVPRLDAALTGQTCDRVLRVYDEDKNLRSTIPVDSISISTIDFRDVNMDGYTDIVITTGGTWNETHDLYVWVASGLKYTKVVYIGFDMLSFFEVYDGYIENFIRGESPDDSYMEILYWNGNALVKEDAVFVEPGEWVQVQNPLTENGAIKVTVNGTRITFDQPPIMENNRVLVPFRALFESMGATVAWDCGTETATASKDGFIVTIQINDSFIYKNGHPIVIDVPARTVGGRTLVPVRAVSECFGADVEWDDFLKMVIIST